MEAVVGQVDGNELWILYNGNQQLTEIYFPRIMDGQFQRALRLSSVGSQDWVRFVNLLPVYGEDRDHD
jgi:hypothetical protein